MDPQATLWNSIDRAFERWLAPSDAALDRGMAPPGRPASPEIAVAPAQGRLLEVLARAVHARRILEIGTLAGHSAIWLARALPADGTLFTLEPEPERARLARENLDAAWLAARVEVMVGPASASLGVVAGRGNSAI